MADRIKTAGGPECQHIERQPRQGSVCHCNAGKLHLADFEWANGKTPYKTNVSVKTAGMAAGNFSCTITFDASGANSIPVTASLVAVAPASASSFVGLYSPRPGRLKRERHIQPPARPQVVRRPITGLQESYLPADAEYDNRNNDNNRRHAHRGGAV